MASLKILATFVALLAISHILIFTNAQESPDEPTSPPEGPGSHGPTNGPDRPPGPPPEASGSHEPSNGSDGPPPPPPGPPSDSSSSSSSTSSDSSDSSQENGQRLFFSGLFGSQRVSCDYATQAGSSCVSCNQRLICTRFGGRLTTCRGFLRYCTDGRCTFRQSDACAAAATTTTTAAATTEAATTTAAETTTATDTTTMASG